jgi:hypothetical protein
MHYLQIHQFYNTKLLYTLKGHWNYFIYGNLVILPSMQILAHNNKKRCTIYKYINFTTQNSYTLLKDIETILSTVT